MKKISIFSENKLFTADLIQQIEKRLPEYSILEDSLDGSEEFVLVDEDCAVLKKIAKQWKEVPVIFISSIDRKNIEADSIILKPFALNEFLTGIENKTILPKVRRNECLTIREYNFFPVKKEIISSLDNQTIKLTEKEVDIIKYLYHISPQSAEKDNLLENVWNYSPDVSTHTIETHIYRLRQKVERSNGSQLIITENNGYRLNI